MNAMSLRKVIPIAVFASAGFLSLEGAHTQESWGTGGASSWGGGATSSTTTTTTHASRSGGSSNWAAGSGSFESKDQKGGVWHAGSTLPPATSSGPGGSTAKSSLTNSVSARPVVNKAAPSPSHYAPVVGKTQPPHFSGGSPSTAGHSFIGPHVGDGRGGHGARFRFSRSKTAASGMQNPFGTSSHSTTSSKTGAGSSLDSLQRSENAVKAAENPSISGSPE